MKKRKGKKLKPWPAPKAPGKIKWLVLLNDAPLRQKAGAKCQRLMAKIEEVRRELEAFEKEDRGAFDRWVASTFGALLTDLRDNQTLLLEKQRIIDLVQTEVFLAGGTYRAAYARVMDRLSRPAPEERFERNIPPPPENEFEEDNDDFDGEEADGDEALFREFVRSFAGVDADDLSDRDYEDLLRQFKAGIKDALPPSFKAPRAREAKSVRTRLKELYRILVRRLHPDTKAGEEAQVSPLWHEVQQAYQDGNVDRLEVLLAMTDLVSQANPEQTTLGQMQLVAVSLERDLNALRRSVRTAKKDMAWNFSRRPDRTALAARIRREMEEELNYQKRSLADMDQQLKSWAEPAKKKKTPDLSMAAVEKELPSRKFPSAQQGEFGF